MTILFVQSWDVVPGKFEDYSAFVTNEYNPTLNRIGLKLLGGYYVAVGAGPRIMAVATVEDQDYLRKILSTEDYRVISSKLQRLVINHSSRLWVSSGRLREGPYRIQMGAWKFNQNYNVVPGMEEEHYKFVKEECMPVMEKLGVPVTQGWRLVIGTGPTTLAECTARSIADIARVIDTAEFKKLVQRLNRDYATDYGSKILSPTGRVEVPSMIGEMMKGF